MQNKSTKVMTVFWFVFFSLAFLVIAGRFVYIQATGVVSGVSLQQLADEKRTNQYSIRAQRGTIFDRNGLPLAQEHMVYRLYAILRESYTTNPLDPKHVKDLEKTANQVAPLINMDPDDMLDILKEGKEKDRFQVEFGQAGKQISQEVKEEIEALSLPGINFTEEPIRFYPNGMFASHTLGLTDKEESDAGENIFGISGMENYMNDWLTGQDGSISYQRDKYNVKLLNPKEVIQEPDHGNDVYLTIDQKIQTLLEDSMSEVVSEYDPERITAVVMDAKTGEILALSNRPSFNPNQLSEVENWYNDVIATPFEPGSTMKIFTLAAAIEEGVWDPNETFEAGSYTANGKVRPINDHSGVPRETMTYLEGIQRSSNVGAAKLAYEKIEPNTFLDYLNHFDFDEKSGIDLPGEVAGRILYDYPIEQITTSFGQGTTVTPIQLVKAASAIANDGEMLQPYIIQQTTEHETGEVIESNSPEVVSQPISKETAQSALDILQTVITAEEGTGHNAYNLTDYTVSGKTGTAQIPDPETPGYMTGHENYIFSFLGMAPAENPELIMYVSVKQPDLNEEEYEPGSAPTSFIFKNVMENSLRYLSIEPDKEKAEPIKAVEIPSWNGKTADEYALQLQQKGLSPIVIGNGEKIERVSIEAGEAITPSQKLLILTDNPTMPDIKGWSLRDVLFLRDFLHLDVEWLGNGYVTDQSINPGDEIKEQDYIMIELSPPNTTEPTDESTDQEQGLENNT
ncbi:penicillin-binding protein [Gracilibacillus sp. YIM 98692]|uniref:penicillin-binding protein n=1 Tax=Gracilibacillus sp. YIM 98692 TaxID=2663532 RepID=UPI0013D710EB|nr:penicillin-binding protein [Gracilibacillus sp. YIM 98692]